MNTLTVFRQGTIFCFPFFLLSIIFTFLYAAEAKDIPNCKYEDTTNITNAQKFANGSYLYGKLLIPPHLVGEYNYEILHNGTREKVPSHKRGCVCQLKSCVKFCCSPNELKRKSERECTDGLEEKLNYSPFLDVIRNNGSMTKINVLDEFVVQQGIPCEYSYGMIPENDNGYEWQLYENGTLMRLYDNKSMTKLEYCLMPCKLNDTYTLNPMLCSIRTQQYTEEIVKCTGMLISIPFLVATIFVYLFISKLRNLHGKCLICYLSALSIGSCLLAHISLSEAVYSMPVCYILGYTTYYMLMAAFCWLSVISFDLWDNFRGNCGVKQGKLRKKFYIYSLYAWGLPLVMSVLAFSLDKLTNLSESLTIGIGYEHCWVNPKGWSAMYYFFGPILILILLNLIMFIATSLKIYQVKNELHKISECEMNKKKDNFHLFLRLFIVMGISWLFETLSYMCGTEGYWNIIFYISDFCNSMQGVIIFITFVLRRKVLTLLKKRLHLQNDEMPSTNRSSKRSNKNQFTSRTMSTRVGGSTMQGESKH